jgi:hypothetical protein
LCTCCQIAFDLAELDVLTEKVIGCAIEVVEAHRISRGTSDEFQFDNAQSGAKTPRPPGQVHEEDFRSLLTLVRPPQADNSWPLDLL